MTDELYRVTVKVATGASIEPLFYAEACGRGRALCVFDALSESFRGARARSGALVQTYEVMMEQVSALEPTPREHLHWAVLCALMRGTWQANEVTALHEILNTEEDDSVAGWACAHYLVKRRRYEAVKYIIKELVFRWNFNPNSDVAYETLRCIDPYLRGKVKE